MRNSCGSRSRSSKPEKNKLPRTAFSALNLHCPSKILTSHVLSFTSPFVKKWPQTVSKDFFTEKSFFLSQYFSTVFESEDTERLVEILWAQTWRNSAISKGFSTFIFNSSDEFRQKGWKTLLWSFKRQISSNCYRYLLRKSLMLTTTQFSQTSSKTLEAISDFKPFSSTFHETSFIF